jgi:ketosteroid isomerase-like protein
MSAAATPRQVFEQLSALVSAGEWGRIADLYAEDAVVEMPFAAPAPDRVEGRESVRAHFAAAAAGPLTLQARDVVVHETGDPEVVIAEYDYHVGVATTGAEFTVANIQVLRIRDGLIVASRDYHDHAAIARNLAPAEG